MTALNQQQQPQQVTVFTTELFAHYMHMKCLSVTKCQQLSDITNSQSSTYKVQGHVKYITNTQELFIADALLWKLLNRFYGQHLVYKQQSDRPEYSTKCPSRLKTSRLVELLQRFAVKHLTRFRQMEVLEFGSVVTIVTTDFEAMYAYKRGDYQQCLQLSVHNVHTLLNAKRMPRVSTFPEFIQLLDDDIVSLNALALIVNSKCRADSGICITQLTPVSYTHLTLPTNREV